MAQERVEKNAVGDGAAGAVLGVYRVSDWLLQVPVTICHMDVSCTAHSLREREAGLGEGNIAKKPRYGPYVESREDR